ncbi:alpha/beta hydrolase [Streptomyces sp. NPDC050560]|uniref:alpha/beta hydrolase n=1 Tax=Streptomyces sp. NPDC050560 TaxID=3365630 RepID=UPI0037A06B1E
MKSETVEYFSGPDRVRALWRTPDAPGPHRAVIQGPGWYGLKDAKAYDRYHEAFTAAGFAVLSIDYRGFGESEGERGIVNPAHQLDDLMNGVSYLTTRDDVVPGAIGAYATGGTGGGNVVLLAAADPRVRAVISQVPVADGRDWLHRMRTEWEWIAYLRALEEDRRTRVLTGESKMIHPRDEVMVQTPERRASGFKKDVDGKNPTTVPFAMVEPLLRYRPVDAARGLTTPLLVVAVEDDATTPTDHAEAIYEAAAGPKKYLLQRNSSHYAAYAQHADAVIPQMTDWFERHLRPLGDVTVLEDPGPRTATTLGE